MNTSDVLCCLVLERYDIPWDDLRIEALRNRFAQSESFRRFVVQESGYTAYNLVNCVPSSDFLERLLYVLFTYGEFLGYQERSSFDRNTVSVDWDSNALSVIVTIKG